MKTYALLAALASAALMSACGSGGSGYDDVTPPPVVVNEVPATALASSTAYTNYTKTLSSTTNEPPVGVNNVTAAPVSETEAPMPL
jgi:hypothetical protein